VLEIVIGTIEPCVDGLPQFLNGLLLLKLRNDLPVHVSLGYIDKKLCTGFMSRLLGGGQGRGWRVGLRTGVQGLIHQCWSLIDPDLDRIAGERGLPEVVVIGSNFDPGWMDLRFNETRGQYASRRKPFCPGNECGECGIVGERSSGSGG